MAKKVRLPETDEGTILYKTDPIIMKWHYEIDYIHSYAQDSPFFDGLSKGKLLGSACKKCKTKYATPRAHCMECGAKTDWIALPLEGKGPYPHHLLLRRRGLFERDAVHIDPGGV
ncbi:MAG: zinc ribbon domain-containing protein [Candidatus Manganitrophus sp.]|nr:zinc ribbon domain-containing protein [Candidatus Manganitrophus sp.]